MRKSRGRMSSVLNAPYVGRFDLYCVFLCFQCFYLPLSPGCNMKAWSDENLFFQRNAKEGDC